MPSVRTALITGATGMIGPTLVRSLLTNGWRVRILVRRQPVDLAQPVETVIGSITDRDTVARAVDGVDVIFHLAALLHIENPPPSMQDEYRRINVDGTRLLAEHAARSAVHRFVYFSTVKVYGVRQRDPVTEDCTPQPRTLYARSKYDGERAAHSVNGLETVSLRLSPVYGPRVKGSWARLVSAIERGYFIPVGSLRNVHSLSHVDDVARAAILAALHPSAAHQRFNLVAHDTPTLFDIFSAIYRSVGRPMPRLRIPASAACAAALAGDKALALIGRRSPFPVEAIRQLVEDEAYSGAKLRQLGFTSGVPLDQGWSSSERSSP